MEVRRKRMSFFLAGALAVAMLFGFAEKSNALEWADGNIKLHGFFKNWTGYRFGFYGSERGSGLSIFRNVLQLEGEYRLHDTVSLVGIFRLAREPNYNLEDDAREAGNFDSDVMDEDEFRELYITWQATENFWAAFGRQQVAWGDLSSQGLRVTDIINPLDLRWHYALENLEEIRKPLIMSNMIYSIPKMEANIQLVWVPGLEEEWRRVNSLYTNPGHRYGLNNLVDPTQPPDYFIPGVPEDDEADPVGISRKISDSEIAIRWQQTLSGLTYSVMLARLHNHAPSVWVDATGLHIKHLRQSIIGVSANWYDKYTNGVFRFEGGYFHHSPFTGNDFSLVREDLFKWGLGYDRNTFFNWLRDGSRSLVTEAQIIQTVIPDNDDFDQQDDSNIGGEKTDTSFSLLNYTGFFNDRVMPFLNLAYYVERKFGLAVFFVNWRPQMFHGNFLITPKLILLYGDTPISGDLGLVRGCSEAVLELTYEF